MKMEEAMELFCERRRGSWIVRLLFDEEPRHNSWFITGKLITWYASRDKVRQEVGAVWDRADFITLLRHFRVRYVTYFNQIISSCLVIREPLFSPTVLGCSQTVIPWALYGFY